MAGMTAAPANIVTNRRCSFEPARSRELTSEYRRQATTPASARISTRLAHSTARMTLEGAAMVEEVAPEAEETYQTATAVRQAATAKATPNRYRTGLRSGLR